MSLLENPSILDLCGLAVQESFAWVAISSAWLSVNCLNLLHLLCTCNVCGSPNLGSTGRILLHQIWFAWFYCRSRSSGSVTAAHLQIAWIS